MRNKARHPSLDSSPDLRAAASALNWDVDPYDDDPTTTVHYLDSYFENINTTCYCMFPRKPFMKWVTQCHEKSPTEKMLIYTMLAHGSVFSSNPEQMRKVHVTHFLEIARHAMGQTVGKFSLPLLQARVILALLEFSLGNASRAWDYCGSATRAASGMKFNMERGLRDISKDQYLEFGFDRATLIECRRRTFWSAYIMDRFNGFCSGHLSMFQNDDCLLRLPCDEALYEGGKIPLTPFFHNSTMDPEESLGADRSGLGLMAYLIEVSSIWGRVLARAYRSEYQSTNEYGHPAEQFYEKKTRELAEWKAGLSSYSHSSPDNIDKAIQGGYIGIFVSLHLLYHCTAMKLNRHVRFKYMSSWQIDRNIRTARHHAREVLNMMPFLAKVERQKRTPEHAFVVSPPFTGYAILTAIDILTSADSLASLPGLLGPMNSGIEVMEELAGFWASAEHQKNLIAERFGNLVGSVEDKGAAAGKVAFFAEKPMETTFGLEHDLIYSAPRLQYLRAIGVEVTGEAALLKIKPQVLSSIKSSLAVNGFERV